MYTIHWKFFDASITATVADDTALSIKDQNPGMHEWTKIKKVNVLMYLLNIEGRY